jgi:hypothetical protein
MMEQSKPGENNDNKNTDNPNEGNQDKKKTGN